MALEALSLAQKTEPNYTQVPGHDREREALKNSILALYESRDISNELVGITDERKREGLEARLYARIELGLLENEKVTDGYLDSIHPELRAAYRDGLIAGTEKYVEGLRTNAPTLQVAGIRQMEVWDRFREKYEELLADELFGPEQ